MLSKEEYAADEIRRLGKTKDWAFLKMLNKISERQLVMLFKLARDNGKCSSHGCGIDFGGATAFLTITDALRRKGLIKKDKDGYQLVEGEPIAYEETVLPKPFIRVRRDIASLYDGEDISDTNASVWLDPRGEAHFHIVIHPEVGEMCGSDPRVQFHGDNILTAHGKSLEECLGRAQAVCFEFKELRHGALDEIILIHYETKAPVVPGAYDKTGLLFQFEKLVLASNLQMYYRHEDGTMEPCRKIRRLAGPLGSEALKQHLQQEKAVIIPYSPERMAALDSIRLRLASMAEEFERVINQENFAEMIATGGAQLLLTSTGKI